MDIEDTASPTKKKNVDKVINLKVDGTAPVVTDIAADSFVGSGPSDISYKLSETSRVTVTIKSGASYDKSKVIATLVSNKKQDVEGAEPEEFETSWDGLDSKGKAAPKTSTKVKYWVEVRAVDLAGNVSTQTENVTYKEITKS